LNYEAPPAGYGSAPNTLDQAHAPLKLSYLQADRRLRDVKTVRSGRETAKINDSGECPHLIEAGLTHQSYPYALHKRTKVPL
jgi:hypothetical protein